MIFALEGPDGCGKSTLYDKLTRSRNLAACFVRMPPISPSLFMHMAELQQRETKLWEQLYTQQHDFICDRHPAVSAPVYDHVFNRSPKLDVTFWLPCVIPVYIHVPTEILLARHRKRGDVHICEANIEPLVEAYKDHLLKFRQYIVLNGTLSVDKIAKEFLNEKDKL